MAVRHYRVIFSRAGVAAPVRAEALMYMEFPVVDAALQVMGCRAQFLMLGEMAFFSRRSVVLKELHHQPQDYILSENKSVFGDSPIR